jgi:hypothetical protein
MNATIYRFASLYTLRATSHGVSSEARQECHGGGGAGSTHPAGPADHTSDIVVQPWSTRGSPQPRTDSGADHRRRTSRGGRARAPNPASVNRSDDARPRNPPADRRRTCAAGRAPRRPSPAAQPPGRRRLGGGQRGPGRPPRADELPRQPPGLSRPAARPAQPPASSRLAVARRCAKPRADRPGSTRTRLRPLRSRTPSVPPGPPR